MADQDQAQGPDLPIEVKAQVQDPEQMLLQHRYNQALGILAGLQNLKVQILVLGGFSGIHPAFVQAMMNECHYITGILTPPPSGKENVHEHKPQ